MPKGYRYVKIGKPYFRVRQNPVVLAWLLWTKNRSLRLDSLGLGRRQALLAVKSLVRHQLVQRSSDRSLVLPMCGNFCLSVHRGYRVFKLRRQTVVRTFDAGVDPAIVAGEIEGVRRASLVECAPAVLDWSIEGRWYEEHFVAGSRASAIAQSDPAAFREMYVRDIEPCLERMMLLRAPLRVNLGDHVDKIRHSLGDRKLSELSRDARKVDKIQRFINSTVDLLYPEGDREIDLVFSHGDFSLRNTLMTEKGMMIIDWESVGCRSALFDLYNCFLTELYYGRAATNLVSEIDQAVLSLQSRLASKAPDIARTLPSLAQAYRRLYYLERIQMLVERDPSDSLLRTILRSIDVFTRHEEAVAIS
jgi:hypothetical protein